MMNWRDLSKDEQITALQNVAGIKPERALQIIDSAVILLQPTPRLENWTI